MDPILDDPGILDVRQGFQFWSRLTDPSSLSLPSNDPPGGSVELSSTVKRTPTAYLKRRIFPW